MDVWLIIMISPYKIKTVHITWLNQTAISVRELYRIIVSNSINTLIALLYNDIEKFYLPRENAIALFTKYVYIQMY